MAHTHCVSVAWPESEDLVAVLRDAEEGDELIRAALRDPANEAFAAWNDGHLVGAAVVQWRPGLASELLYIAVVAERRGNGDGRTILSHLIDELPRHGRRLVVGTSNSSLDNIAFYQRCGFRMDAVKRDHFDYVQPPVIEHGITMRDMIVFAYELPEQPDQSLHPAPADVAGSEVVSPD